MSLIKRFIYAIFKNTQSCNTLIDLARLNINMIGNVLLKFSSFESSIVKKIFLLNTLWPTHVLLGHLILVVLKKKQ